MIGYYSKTKAFNIEMVTSSKIASFEVFVIKESEYLSFFRVSMNSESPQEKLWDIAIEDYCEDANCNNPNWNKTWINIYDGMPSPFITELGSAIRMKILELGSEEI
jgi:hypothetical protein